ncbi:MAG: bicyclomycin resistance protein [Rubrivivax sp.]|nr:bicyclomycin resistance protein [Rubrivivax sp.]
MSAPGRPRRREALAWLAGGGAAAAWPEPGAAAAPAATPAPATALKRLRVAFNTAETSLDPSVLQDTYSRTITPHIFEALYQYDYLARPVRIKPLTAAALPEVSDDFRVWTIRLRSGIHFAQDPAFRGRRRELIAQDYIFSIQRAADPATKCPWWSWFETFGILGIGSYRKELLASKGRFDYDRAQPGLVALDRHTLRFTLAEPQPRFLEGLANSDLLGAQAREVVEFYGDRIAEHPVGTGPYRLKSWRRSSQIVLERNPDFREMLWEAEPAPDDAAGQAIAAKLRGRRVPLIDEVQVSIIDEDQPRWLSFLNGQIDLIAGKTGSVPGTFVTQAMPNGRVAPHLARRGIQGEQLVNPDVAIYFFNMEDPVVGGYTPDKVALRRAISLGWDVQREIRIIRRGQAVPAQSMVVPHTVGYDPRFKSEVSQYDPARANALLDLYGYRDADGDGWREQPDGRPLTLEYTSQSEQIYRDFQGLFVKNMREIGLRVNVVVGQWPEQAKQARAGKLMMWGLGSSATSPDGQGSFQRLHGPQSGGANLARFRLPAFDALYDRMSVLPNGPEREALFVQAKKLAAAYVPYKATVHRITTDLWHPWVIGYRRPVFHNEWWHMIDIDEGLRPAGQTG